MNLENIFNRPQVRKAFARAETLLGGQAFKLDDERELVGTASRVHRGETMLSNGKRIDADTVIVATRAQFTPAAPGSVEVLPVALESSLDFEGMSWRVEYVATDEAHVSLYLCRNPVRVQ